MAQNPMQRKMTNSFLLGMFITLLIAAIIVGLLLVRINKLSDEKTALEEAQQVATKTVYVAKDTIAEGATAYGTSDTNGDAIELIQQKQVTTDIAQDSLLTSDMLVTVNEQTGEETVNVMKAKFEIPAGTIITKNMLENAGVDDSERLMEYNMISLPSQLLEGTYIDIRLLLPNGEDFVVVSKKYVEQVSYTTVWLKMSEDEIEALSNAIIESYIIDGAKLYATTYSSPESQTASKCTYVPNEHVRAILENMLADGELKNTLKNSWNTFMASGYRTVIDNYINSYEDEDVADRVTEGVEEEVTELQSARDTFLENEGY